MDRRALRMEVLTGCGAGSASMEELLRYNENAFDSGSVPASLRFPLPDEPFVEAWEQYAAEAASEGVPACLRGRLPQFCFPIEKGISATESYRAATRRGVQPEAGPGLPIRSAEQCRLVIHSTPAGRIPLVILGDRADFVSCVQALSHRNEPVPVPDSMGACIIGGYNNWDRVRQFRRQWASSANDVSEEAWLREFERLVPRKELYQDRFILLSEGPYSGVASSELGLRDEEWRKLSLGIRREHECAHYFTRRVFGSMRNNVLDELIADYSGIVAACGRFRADWLLRFLGLHEHPLYREGGRLQNYRGDPPLSDRSFAILQELVVRAANHLEEFDRARRELLKGPNAQGVMQLVLAGFTVEELAATASLGALEETLTRRLQQCGHGEENVYAKSAAFIGDAR